MLKLAPVVLLLLLAVPGFARRRPDFRMFPPTADSLIEQNAEANRLSLPRIQNDRHLRELVDAGELVQVRSSAFLTVGVPSNRAYLRPWTADALQDMAVDFHTTFGTPMQLNSAVRTVQFQGRLRRWNRNAAPAHGERASVHPAGIAFDLKRRGLSPAQRRWVQWRLFYLRARGLAIVEEERRHQCFHVVVSGDYSNSGMPVYSRLADGSAH